MQNANFAEGVTQGVLGNDFAYGKCCEKSKLGGQALTQNVNFAEGGMNTILIFALCIPTSIHFRPPIQTYRNNYGRHLL
jgi:hypothetical protein